MRQATNLDILIVNASVSIKPAVGAKGFRASVLLNGNRVDGQGATQTAAITDLQNRLKTLIGAMLS